MHCRICLVFCGFPISACAIIDQSPMNARFSSATIICYYGIYDFKQTTKNISKNKWIFQKNQKIFIYCTTALETNKSNSLRRLFQYRNWQLTERWLNIFFFKRMVFFHWIPVSFARNKPRKEKTIWISKSFRRENSMIVCSNKLSKWLKLGKYNEHLRTFLNSSELVLIISIASTKLFRCFPPLLDLAFWLSLCAFEKKYFY